MEGSWVEKLEDNHKDKVAHHMVGRLEQQQSSSAASSGILLDTLAVLPFHIDQGIL